MWIYKKESIHVVGLYKFTEITWFSRDLWIVQNWNAMDAPKEKSPIKNILIYFFSNSMELNDYSKLNCILIMLGPLYVDSAVASLSGFQV